MARQGLRIIVTYVKNPTREYVDITEYLILSPILHGVNTWRKSYRQNQIPRRSTMSGLRIENLIKERELAKSLGVSKATMLNLRSRGCPYVRLGGRVFYEEETWMVWVIGNLTMEAQDGVVDPNKQKKGKKK
jgi:hypothetical protein